MHVVSPDVRIVERAQVQRAAEEVEAERRQVPLVCRMAGDEESEVDEDYAGLGRYWRAICIWVHGVAGKCVFSAARDPL